MQIICSFDSADICICRNGKNLYRLYTSDDRFLAACSARPKYRLIVFEAEISLGWGRRVAEEEEEEEEG